jgi:hypothetical protein
MNAIKAASRFKDAFWASPVVLVRLPSVIFHDGAEAQANVNTFLEISHRKQAAVNPKEISNRDTAANAPAFESPDRGIECLGFSPV